jgi:hypothetical protein
MTPADLLQDAIEALEAYLHLLAEPDVVDEREVRLADPSVGAILRTLEARFDKYGGNE